MCDPGGLPGAPEMLAALGEAVGRLPGLAPPPALAPPLCPAPAPGPALGPAEVELTWQEILSLSELQGLDMAGEALYEPPFCPLLPPACPYAPCPPPPPAPPPAPPAAPMGAPAAFPPPPPFPAALPCSEAAAPTPAPAPCPPPGRDARRALALRIPIPTEKIVNLPVEDFNALVGRYPLSEPQLALVRDIRRRGKNKVAAQNCRRRKLETIARLQGELSRLGRERERLLRDRGLAERALGALRRDLGRLSRQVLGALRDAAGNPLPPESFALRLAPDGAVCLVPRAARSEPGD